MEYAEDTARVNGIRMHFLTAGQGPLVMLLHGWPETSFMWRDLIKALAHDRTVVAPDLRGYGRSDKPIDGFDKRTMASDVRALARHLGHDKLSIVGHDRGARVAHRYCLDNPDEVERAVFMDIIPTLALFRQTEVAVARNFWHWLFHTQPDIPELLIANDIEGYLLYFFERWTSRRVTFDPEALALYVSAFEAPGALRCFLDDYRATFRGDLEQDEESAAQGLHLKMPVLVLWGEEGLVGRLPVVEIWREYADDARGEAVPDCGHFLAEERPDVVADHLLRFLA